MGSLFQTVKGAVTARQAAEAYGLSVSRTGMVCCPFHSDKSPSMKIDDRYYCFGCGVTGDAIDLTAQLFGLSSKDAAEKLAADFGIMVPDDRDAGKWKRKKSLAPVLPRADPEKEKNQEIQRGTKVLLDYLWLLRDWQKEYAPQSMDEEWHPLFCEALEKQSYVEYLLDELISCSKDQQWEVYCSCRKEVDAYEERMERYFSGTSRDDRADPGDTFRESEGRDQADDPERSDSSAERSAVQRSDPIQSSNGENGYRQRCGMVKKHSEPDR